MSDWALITGASSGIGLELARLFAGDSFDLILVARNETRLKQIAQELHARHGIQVQVIAKDLAAPAAPQEIVHQLHATPVAALVNNAGFGRQGTFADGRLPEALDMMRVNMEALVQLTHLLVQPMISRRHGRILNVASTAAFQPGPLTAIYYATKAFVYSFSCALTEELSGSGVTVTTLCPGATRTQFHDRAGMQASLRRLHLMSARAVAVAGYRGLMRGKRVVIPGTINRVLAGLAKAAPAVLTAKAVRKINGG